MKLADKLLSTLSENELRPEVDALLDALKRGARRHNISKVYASHDEGVSFDAYSGNVSVSLEHDEHTQKFALSIRVFLEMSSEIEDALQMLDRKRYAGGPATAGEAAAYDIMAALDKGYDAWQEAHPEDSEDSNEE